MIAPNNELLLAVARKSGVPASDVRKVVVALRDPLSGVTHAGSNDTAIPPFVWPSHAENWADLFPGWSGLTPGEYDNSTVAEYWRAMCDRLLDERTVYAWELKPWPHPVKD